MKTIEFKITGKTALLFNKFDIEIVSNKSSRVKTGSAGNDPEEWRTKVICEGKRLYIPNNYVFSCLGEGGTYVKEGRGTLKKKLMSCLLVNQEKFFLNYELPKEINEIQTSELPRDSSHNVYLDIRSVTNPMTKGRNIRYRIALAPGWVTTIQAEWDDTVISRDSIKQVIEAAGKFVGLSDGRTRGFGRFLCDDIKIL